VRDERRCSVHSPAPHFGALGALRQYLEAAGWRVRYRHPTHRTPLLFEATSCHAEGPLAPASGRPASPPGKPAVVVVGHRPGGCLHARIAERSVVKGGDVVVLGRTPDATGTSGSAFVFAAAGGPEWCAEAGSGRLPNGTPGSRPIPRRPHAEPRTAGAGCWRGRPSCRGRSSLEVLPRTGRRVEL